MSEEDLELLITLDDPVQPQVDDSFNHLRAGSTFDYWLGHASSQKFDVEVCTVTRWKNGAIVEQKVFYDLLGMQRQIGVS